ncbi:MAG: hypothetical protein AAFQ98_08460 [Bacteroidota bacterium]
MEKDHLFISHSSQDVEKVTCLIELLAGCFSDIHHKIICSSVQGYSYPFGVKIADNVQEDIAGAHVLVLWTNNVKRSDWVFLEFGMAMATAQSIVTAIDHPSYLEKLPSYVNNTQVLHLHLAEQLLAFVKQLGHTLSWQLQEMDTVQEAIEAYLEKLSTDRFPYPKETLIPQQELFETFPLKWEKLCPTVTEELIVIGWSNKNALNTFAEQHFQKLVEQGKKITVVVQSREAITKSPQLNFGPVCNHARFPERIIDDIGDGVKGFQNIHRGISEEKQDNLRLVETDYLITWSAVAVDIDQPHGIIQLEFYLYEYPIGAKADSRKNELQNRPSLVLTPESKFYLHFQRSIRSILESENLTFGDDES